MTLLRTSFPRGNALLLTLIAVSVLMVLVVGAIQFTNSNREATTEKLRGTRSRPARTRHAATCSRA